MKWKVCKDNCPVCDPKFHGWIVTDHRGNYVYFSRSWKKALEYACSATQPGTGAQVQPRRESN